MNPLTDAIIMVALVALFLHVPFSIAGTDASLASQSEIWFVRHAESEFNVMDALTERDKGVTYPLTQKGMRQAVDLADQLKDIKIVKIYSSTRMRAIQTADAVGLSHGVPITLAPEMVEINLGADPEVDNIREVSRLLAEQWRTDPHAKYGDGESIVDLQERAFPFVRQLIEHHKDDRGVVMVFAHGGSIRLGVLPLCSNNIDGDQLDPASLPNTGVLKTRIVGDELICTQWVNQEIVSGVASPPSGQSGTSRAPGKTGKRLEGVAGVAGQGRRGRTSATH